MKQAFELDLRETASIDKVVAAIGEPVDSVFSCAGLPGPPFSDLDTVLVNFIGARHMIDSLVPKMPPGSGVATVSSAASQRRTRFSAATAVEWLRPPKCCPTSP